MSEYLREMIDHLGLDNDNNAFPSESYSVVIADV